MALIAQFTDRRQIPVVRASSWKPTLLVNTEAFQAIDDTDTTADIALRFGDTLNKNLFYERSRARFKFDDDLYILGDLSVTGLMSGKTLKIYGSMSGNSLFVARAFSGAGLSECTGANKLLWSASTGRFSCAADQTGGGGSSPEVGTSSFSGGVLRLADSRLVNTSGDTMTGMLVIDITNGNRNTRGLNVINTISGAVVHASKTLTSSGDLVIEGNFFFGDSIADAVTVNAGAWSFSNATNFSLSNAQNAFSIDTDTFSVDALNNRIGIRTTTPDNPLEVVGTISGTSLRTSNGASHSGGLALETSLTGATIAGFGLPDCDTAATSKLLYDLTTKKFSCGTDQTGGGGGVSLTRIAGNSGAAGADMTWQNLTVDSATCTTVALCAASMTTTGVGAGTWKFKYTLIYQTAATTTGIAFGINHTGTAGQFQAMWTHITTGGAAATGIGDNDAATVAGQLAEGKHEGVLNAVLGSATAGVAVANSDILVVLEGIIVTTASGNLELKLGSEVAGSAVRLMADSTLELVKIE